MSTHLHPAAKPARPLPLARAAGVLRGHEAHEVLGRLVAGIAAPQPKVDASLAAETETMIHNSIISHLFLLKLKRVYNEGVAVHVPLLIYVLLLTN